MLTLLLGLALPAFACDYALDVDSVRSEAKSHYDDGDYAGFVTRMEQVAAATRDETDVYNLACGYALSGRPDQAISVLQSLMARGSSFDLHDSDLDSLRSRPDFAEIVKLSVYYDQVNEKLEPVRDRAMTQYEAGRYDLFTAIMEDVARYSKNDRDIYNLACGYARTGRAEDALAQLQILAERRADFDPGDDSDFASIRKDPRFLALAAKMSRS